MEESDRYILTLDRRARRLPFLFALFILALAFLVIRRAMESGDSLILLLGIPPLLLFPLVWSVMRGPKTINVEPVGRAEFVDHFGRSRTVRLEEVRRIRANYNLLVLHVGEEKISGLNGFDGLHRFILDVKRHNPALQTEGI